MTYTHLCIHMHRDWIIVLKVIGISKSMTHVQMHGKSISSIVWDYDYRGNKYRCIFLRIQRCKDVLFFFFHQIVFIAKARKRGKASFESSTRIRFNLFQITIIYVIFIGFSFLMCLKVNVELITCVVARLLWYNSWRSLNIFNDHPCICNGYSTVHG